MVARSSAQRSVTKVSLIEDFRTSIARAPRCRHCTAQDGSRRLPAAQVASQRDFAYNECLTLSLFKGRNFNMALTQAMRVAGERPRRREHVPGQIIVRLKPALARRVAADAPRAATSRALAGAMPDEVRDPIDFLRDNFGLQSMKPLFVVDAG